MKDALFGILAVVFAILAAYFFYTFQTTENDTLNMVLGVVSVLIAIVCGVAILSKRVNKAEDIHITE